MSRPIPDRLVQKYHLAIFAIDPLGVEAKTMRWGLRIAWQQLQRECAAKNETNDPGIEARLDHMIATMTDSLEACIARHEKDRQRPEWQKQKDFLVGTMRRVRRATTLDDTDHLHFFSGAEMFDAHMQHARFQVGYKLWQAIRTEMKEALSLTLYGSAQPHPIVLELHTAIRRIVTALETASIAGLNHYDPAKSALHLSEEQQGRMLWEAVREEIGKTVVMADARVAA